MKKYQLGALTVSDKGLQDTKEEFEAEEERLRKERREALQDWISENGLEACRAEVEKIWNGA